jgi:hypothetical protein
MKNAVFWDVAPCRSCVNRRFGGTFRLHLQGTLKMEEIRSSETSVYTRSTRRHIPEDDILQLNNSLSSPNIIKVIKLRIMRWVEDTERKGK